MEFPEIKDYEVAVLMAEAATGTVLNVHGEWYLNKSSDEIYRVFGCFDSAKEYISRQIHTNNKVEFLIYDSNKKLLEYIKGVS